ncbi:MAG TPA: hypothetical protein VNO70_15260, partial [Blastocatellia bacterium]|nr:hypothetical protein [Blastocatellia bacterium]
MKLLLSAAPARSSARRFFVIFLTFTLLVAGLLPSRQAGAQVPSASSKLSPALQQALNSSADLVWSISATQSVRVLIQTNGPVSPGLLQAVTLRGGKVVRQFTS